MLSLLSISYVLGEFPSYNRDFVCFASCFSVGDRSLKGSRRQKSLVSEEVPQLRPWSVEFA